MIARRLSCLTGSPRRATGRRARHSNLEEYTYAQTPCGAGSREPSGSA
jgi:hypothetical protein